MPSQVLSAFRFSANRSLNFTFRVILFHGLTFVVQFLPFAEPHHTLGDTAIRKIESKRNQCQPPFLGSSCKFQILSVMNQQLSNPFGRVIPYRCLSVFVYFAAYQPKFTVFDSSIGFLNGAFSVAKTFDFAAMQNDATFQRV